MHDHNDYMKERRVWLDKYNYCHKCGKQKCAPDRKFCFDCLEVIREDSAKRYDSEKAKQYQKRRRELYREHKEKGICIRCSNPATHGIYCYECSIKAKRHSQESSARRKRERHERGLIPEMRKEDGLCFFCGEKNDRSRYSECCSKCANKFSEISYRGDKTFFNAWRKSFWEERKAKK